MLEGLVVISTTDCKISVQHPAHIHRKHDLCSLTKGGRREDLLGGFHGEVAEVELNSSLSGPNKSASSMLPISPIYHVSLTALLMKRDGDLWYFRISYRESLVY